MSGIFGFVPKKKNINCIDIIVDGAVYNCDRGSAFGSISFFFGNKLEREIYSLATGDFKSKVYNLQREYRTNKKINTGMTIISDLDEQPIKVSSKFGEYAVGVDGKINNIRKIVNNLIKKYNISLKETKNRFNEAEIVGEIINLGNSIEDGINLVHEMVDGSISLQVLTKNGIYASSDKFPFAIGENDKGYAITSETCAFPNLGIRTIKHLKPKQIIHITGDGPELLKEESNGTICLFNLNYFLFPISEINGLTAQEFRERCGACLAEYDKNENINARIAGDIPSSGTHYRIGYINKVIDLALEKILQYADDFANNNINLNQFKGYLKKIKNNLIKTGTPFIKFATAFGKSFIQLEEIFREYYAAKKLLPIRDLLVKEMLEDDANEIIITEDSTITGNQFKSYRRQLRNIEKNVWGQEIKSIHLRIGSPAALFGCIYSHAGKNQNKLATRRAIKAIEGRHIKDISEYVDINSPRYKEMLEWVAKDLGVKTIKHITLDDSLEAAYIPEKNGSPARGLPREEWCTYCWSGIKS